MHPPLLRSAAVAWLTLFELYLLPLRAIAAPSQRADVDDRQLQEEVWSAILAHGPVSRVDQPIFTDEIVARAKAH